MNSRLGLARRLLLESGRAAFRTQVLEHKLSGIEICFPLTRINGNWVAEIVDSEGNHIEVTAPC